MLNKDHLSGTVSALSLSFVPRFGYSWQIFVAMAEGKGDGSRCKAPGDVGELWMIPHFDRSGLFSIVHFDKLKTQVVHYVREETKVLWNKLEQCRLSESNRLALLRVYGDPGSGKSSTVWGYTQFMGMKSPVAWVTQRSLGYQLAWISAGNAPNHSVFKFNDFDSMVSTLLGGKPTLVVLDGIVANSPAVTCTLPLMLETLMVSMNHRCFFVICTSFQSANHYGAYLMGVVQKDYFVCGWTVDEILAARKAAIKANMPVFPAALLDETDDSAFRKQLHVAGGSIRFMMEEYAAVQAQLRALIPRNWADLWLAARAKFDKYNRLFVHDRRRKSKNFVSEFLSKEISRLVPLQELDRAATIDPANEGFMGMIFKIRLQRIFEDAVNVGKSVTFTKTKLLSLPETFRISKIVDDSEVQGGGLAHLEFCTVCHIPVKRNPGCFDFALIRREKNGKYHVYFLQFTVAEHQSARMHYAAEFLRIMYPNNVVVQAQTRSQNMLGTAPEVKLVGSSIKTPTASTCCRSTSTAR